MRTNNELAEIAKLKSISQFDDATYAYLTIFHNEQEHKIMYPKKDTTIITEFTNTPLFSELGYMEYVQNMGLEGVYIDCGGYLGMHSLFHKTYSGATKVFCFEPNPVMYKCAVENTRHEEDIYVFNTAVGSKVGTATLSNFDDYTYGQFTLMNHVVCSPKFNVNINTIDNVVLPLLEKGEKVAYIKLDVEGYEGEALVGAIQTLIKYKPVIYTEIWRINKVYRYICKFLTDLGYELMYSTEQHYFWRYKYTGLDIKKEQLELDAHVSIVAKQLKPATLTTYFANKPEGVAVYTTNRLDSYSTSLMENLGKDFPNTRFIGYDSNRRTVDEAAKAITHTSLTNRTHFFQGEIQDSFYKFGDRDINVYDLYIDSDLEVSSFLNNVYGIIKTVREGGLLVLNFNLNTIRDSSKVLAIFEYLEQEFLIVKQQTYTKRFYYNTAGSETNKIYYIHL